ncbi:helix-turn-helix domain-containing protein [Chryseobacterium limigenitum]|uniref:Resolvase HTH domain-containing protein n=2 Tax=Chryseobacterium limigenitum TaxID=1612149 RepID=A0A1K2IWZ7_9FLAO|nr:helix-turn-helix domain-containing protein [Chryseobacterium limigenitum]SFZ96961.1 hypothetical protein SAMN05216324_13120 [Chryseobacterium limigenitum]
MNFKDIHIGSLISQHAEKYSIEISRICKFFKCSEREIEAMYESENLGTDILLKWSKLLEYDFFRIYSQHLVLYSPPKSQNLNQRRDAGNPKSVEFRKSVYTKEIIDFILDLVASGEKSKAQIIEEYKIPKTTLYKWIKKHPR